MQQKWPNEPIDWVGGKLYFMAHGIQIPNTPEIPKPGQRTVGWVASQRPIPGGPSHEVRAFLMRTQELNIKKNAG
jgi:hypothetical protein